jgi:hypothetical protein
MTESLMKKPTIILRLRSKEPPPSPPKKRRPYVSPNFRWLSLNESGTRLDLQGVFTSGDLRKLADWLDNPKHPTIAGVMIDVELSPLV